MASAATDVDRSDVTEQLHRTFASPTYRPPMLPGAALEVMALAQRPNVQFDAVVKVLERDPVLAARILSISNSAALAGRSPILTLHQAVVRLGLQRLREVVLEAALHLKIFRVPGFDEPMARLGRHSTATAHVMRAVCRRLSVDTEHAFLCGLLHDVGFAASLLALADDPAWRKRGFDELAAVLDEVHEEAAAVLMRLWNLPGPVQELVATHHDVHKGTPAARLHAALVVAEQLAWEAGAGMMPPPDDANPMSLATPEPPIDGIDVNWSGVVDEAKGVLGLEDLPLAAARAEAFEIVRGLGAPARAA